MKTDFDIIVLYYVRDNPGCGSRQITNALDEFVNFKRKTGRRNWFIFYMAKLARDGKIRKSYGVDYRGAVQYYITGKGLSLLVK